VASNSKLGKILVDSRGRTLYLFSKDTRTKSACSGACATPWPPLRANGRLSAGGGVNASKLGTIRRSDGKPQVTYNGHPLYGFVMDTKAGDTKGEGLTAFGGHWFVISPTGKQVSPKKSSGGSASAAPKPAPKPAPAPTAPKPAPAKPAPKPAPPSNNGIPQNNGGDHDSDNNGGPSDGDGGI
jgi:predicted lipoprotein with Yx(FWY)xxD motif